jgi:hypothetical protein
VLEPVEPPTLLQSAQRGAVGEAGGQYVPRIFAQCGVDDVVSHVIIRAARPIRRFRHGRNSPAA